MDIRSEITNTIIAMLEKGAGEWKCPWQSVAARGMPRNFTTSRAYTGVNVLLLWNAAQQRGYERNEWLTFNQARDIGAKVRKGAKGVMCIFYKMVERNSKSEAGEAEGDEGMVPMLKPFWVFNVADVEGLPEQPAPVLREFQAIEEGEFILKASGAQIQHGGNRACYSPAADLIRLPHPDQFKAPVNYYAVALHELAHWTGHESRLAREYGKRFGDEAYAFEELVAELGSAFVMADLGLNQYSLEGHASYVQSWLNVLKNDKSAIFTAAKAASAAHALIVSHAGRKGEEAGA